MRQPRRRPPVWNRGPKVFRVAWRWRPGVDEGARERVRIAIGGWLASKGWASVSWRPVGRGEALYVHGLEGGGNLGRGRAKESESRTIHSFVVASLGSGQVEGPVRSGLRTARRGRAAPRSVTGEEPTV